LWFSRGDLLGSVKRAYFCNLLVFCLLREHASLISKMHSTTDSPQIRAYLSLHSYNYPTTMDEPKNTDEIAQSARRLLASERLPAELKRRLKRRL